MAGKATNGALGPYIDDRPGFVAYPNRPIESHVAPQEHYPSSEPGHWSHGFVAGATGPGAVIVLHHAGAIDHALLEQLVERAEAWSLEASDSVVSRKRLLNVLVEALENLRVHTEPHLAASALALLVADEEAYRLFVGNALPAATAELLLNRVEVINAMSDADLKEHFLRLLSSEGRTERGGAGLGLLTLGRKSARPLVTHDFARDAHTRYLVLEVRVLRDR